MSIKDFHTRLQAMLNKECNIENMEIGIAKKSAKYFKEASELRIILEKQVQEFEMLSLEVEKLKSHNQKLEKSLQEDEQRLAATTKNIQELQTEYDIEMQRLTELRKTAQMKMALLHKIKETTQTGINLHALPYTLEGAKHFEKETSWKWKPFVQDVKEWISYIEEQFENVKKPDDSTETQNMTPVV